ncbi:MAG: ABC transporter ATP-binding protein [Chloroflexi bacterium]|jgi:branched-chain amino acid transport system ATP-binding protein|nr:MAG: ABC transporter ATP-binding protein [Chloroflexota bacterium]
MALLELKDVNTYYGAVHALRGVSLKVEEGEIVTLIGSNGAGKTTTLRTISGLERARSGSITLNGQSIESLPPHQIVALGISHAPEGRRVFARMSVRENLEMGAFLRRGADVEKDFQKVFELFPRLKEREFQAAGTMSGGEQQMLAIGRALMAQPKILLLDEPSMGLAPILVEQIFDIVKEINQRGTAVLLVEQNAMMALGIAKRGYILQIGEVTLGDDAAKLANNPKVKEAYLGV